VRFADTGRPNEQHAVVGLDKPRARQFDDLGLSEIVSGKAQVKKRRAVMQDAASAAIVRLCRNCQKPFRVSPEELAFFDRLRLRSPRRCRPCRDARRDAGLSAVRRQTGGPDRDSDGRWRL
jgi:hypothetical protein